VPGNAEQFCAGVVRPADAGKPMRAAPHDIRHHGDGFDVVDRRGRAVEADVGGKRRFQARLTLLAFEAFQQRRLFAADVGTGAMVHDDIEGKAVDVILADEIGLVGLVHRRLQALALAHKLAADVDEAGMRPHGEAGHQAAFDQQMRVVAHDLAILAGAGLRLVGIDDEIMRPPVGLLRHERPLEAGGKACAAAAAQAGGLDLVDNAIAALLEDRFGAIPRAPRARARKPPVVQAVEVRENTILILEHQDCLFADASAAGGLGAGASCTFAASPGFLASASRNGGPCVLPPLPRE
jgi:hypothetical protein